MPWSVVNMLATMPGCVWIACVLLLCFQPAALMASAAVGLHTFEKNSKIHTVVRVGDDRSLERCTCLNMLCGCVCKTPRHASTVLHTHLQRYPAGHNSCNMLLPLPLPAAPGRP